MTTNIIITQNTKSSFLNVRRLKIQKFSNVNEFKLELLMELKLYSQNADNISVFHTIISSYLNRHHKTLFEISLNKGDVYDNIYENILNQLTAQPIPKGYPLGASNMETQGFYNPIPSVEFEKQKAKAKNMCNEEFNNLLSEIDKLNLIQNLTLDM